MTLRNDKVQDKKLKSLEHTPDNGKETLSPNDFPKIDTILTT